VLPALAANLFMLPTYAASLGCWLSRASNPGLLLCSQVLVFIFPVLEMHNSWKEIYISKMNFMNPELNFKSEIRKIKQEMFIILIKEIINDISKQHFPFLK
jgi:hypothetical protein